MNRIVPLVLLVLGIGIAASFGARNGPSHTAWRQAKLFHGQLAAVQAMETEVPPPEEGEETAEEKAEREEASAKLAEARKEALEALIDAGAIASAFELPAAVTRAEQAIPPVPDPQTRLSEWASTGGVGVLLIGLGAFLARRQQAEAAASGEAHGDLDFAATVARLHKEVAALADQASRVPMDDDAPVLRAAIESLHNDEIGPLVDGRGVFIAQHGIGTFAEYFGPFSAGERNLHRAWSALTDGHSPVATEALKASAEAFARAGKAWPETVAE